MRETFGSNWLSTGTISPPGELVCTKQHKLNNWCTMQRRAGLPWFGTCSELQRYAADDNHCLGKQENVFREREKEWESSSFFHQRCSKPNLQRPDYWFMKVSALQQQQSWKMHPALLATEVGLVWWLSFYRLGLPLMFHMPVKLHPLALFALFRLWSWYVNRKAARQN